MHFSVGVLHFRTFVKIQCYMNYLPQSHVKSKQGVTSKTSIANQTEGEKLYLAHI